MLAFRLSSHQRKFDWKGSLAFITTLMGGGYLTHLSNPMNCAYYLIGYFFGLVSYLIYLFWRWKHISSASPGFNLKNMSILSGEVKPENFKDKKVDETIKNKIITDSELKTKRKK
ncbi:MAG: hypothetical protein GY928_04760 [Colwellia sp.]|nr:hypothetical protein [Colwellia sp.]